jgi:phage replication initiation protein
MKYPPLKSTATEESLIGLGALRPDEQALPRLVIRGESPTGTHHIDLESQDKHVAFVDYLSFTFRNHDPIKDHFPLRDVILGLFNIPIDCCQLANKGRNGYTHCITFGGFGSLSWGGESQRNTIHVQISGQGCKLISDWLAVYTWGITNDAKITRLDLAHDDYTGVLLTIKKAVEWYDDGLFNSAGRPPKRRLIYDFDEGDGQTFYVGCRGNSKFVRIYEKGRQLGDSESPWVRAEVEFLAKDQLITWESLLEPDAFLTGSYPAFAFLSEKQSRFERIGREANLSLEKIIEWGRTSCGNLINALCILHDNDFETVVNILRRDGIPKSLELHFERHLSEVT